MEMRIVSTATIFFNCSNTYILLLLPLVLLFDNLTSANTETIQKVPKIATPLAVQQTKVTFQLDSTFFPPLSSVNNWILAVAVIS